MNLLPLGTVIQVNAHKVCIIGYGSVEKEKSKSGYFVVSYPLGFTNVDKVFFIPCDLEFEMLAEGYKTKPSEKALKTLSKGFEMVENVSEEELLKFDEKIKKAMSLKKEAAKE